MGDKRPSRRTTVQGLQHRGFHLQEAFTFQVVAQRTHHLDAGKRVSAGGIAHDQVGVTLPHAGVLAHVFVSHRQRAQGLGRHVPGASQHG